MNISKQISAIKDCLRYEQEVEVTYYVSTFDSNIVTYYVTYHQGTNGQINRKIELTVEKNKVFWIITDSIGNPTNVLDSLRKAIREAK